MIRSTTSKRLRAMHLLLLGAVALAAGGATCQEKKDHHVWLVPEENTAADQFSVAARQEREARGVYEESARLVEMDKAIAAYRSVEQRFPDDAKFSPAAALIIGNLEKELGRPNGAIAQYQHALKRYPNDSDVRVSALFGLGECYDALKQPVEAQRYYRLLIDEFGDSRDPRVRELVETARAKYRQIRPLS